jgi:hypothetical protein
VQGRGVEVGAAQGRASPPFGQWKCMQCKIGLWDVGKYKGDRVRAVDRGVHGRAVEGDHAAQDQRWGVLRSWVGKALECDGDGAALPARRSSRAGPCVARQGSPRTSAARDSRSNSAEEAPKLKAAFKDEACAWRESCRGLRRAPGQPEEERGGLPAAPLRMGVLNQLGWCRLGARRQLRLNSSRSRGLLVQQPALAVDGGFVAPRGRQSTSGCADLERLSSEGMEIDWRPTFSHDNVRPEASDARDVRVSGRACYCGCR